MAYSPAQGLLLALLIGGWASYLVSSALRKGTVPRAKPYWGELPPEMGTVIRRDKQPRRFWINVWIGVAFIALSIFMGALSIAFMFDPSL
jgi:hypothetical protein